MADYSSYVGKKFGSWTVVGVPEEGNYLRCKCVCGTKRKITPYRLRSKKTNSCQNCSMVRFKSEKRTAMHARHVGSKHGEFTVIGLTESLEHVETRLICRCSCGNVSILNRCSFVNGSAARSCKKCRVSVSPKKTERFYIRITKEHKEKILEICGREKPKKMTFSGWISDLTKKELEKLS